MGWAWLQRQEQSGGAPFHTPGGGTFIPMTSDPLALLSLHPSARKDKLKLTLRYLGNPERGGATRLDSPGTRCGVR
jgi:hypothetical protein